MNELIMLFIDIDKLVNKIESISYNASHDPVSSRDAYQVSYLTMEFYKILAEIFFLKHDIKKLKGIIMKENKNKPTEQVVEKIELIMHIKQPDGSYIKRALQPSDEALDRVWMDVMKEYPRTWS